MKGIIGHMNIPATRSPQVTPEEDQALCTLNQFPEIEVNRPNKSLFILESFKVTGPRVQGALDFLRAQGWRTVTTTPREKRRRPYRASCMI